MQRTHPERRADESADATDDLQKTYGEGEDAVRAARASWATTDSLGGCL